MENNIENKKRFLAQYWGQEIAIVHIPHEGESKDKVGTWNIKWISFLELKPLSSITDEDAIEVRNIVKETMYFDDELPNGMLDINTLKKGINRMFNDHTGCWLTVWNNSQMNDYLRSKGYALPYMGLSVEEQVSRGWVKLVGIPEGLYIDKNTLK